jgi:hypothetical protein
MKTSKRAWFRVHWKTPTLEGCVVVEAKTPDEAKQHVREMYPQTKLRFGKVKAIDAR